MVAWRTPPTWMATCFRLLAYSSSTPKQLYIHKALCLYHLLASERSERDTYRGNTIENRGCLFIYMDVRMSFCTLTLAFLC